MTVDLFGTTLVVLVLTLVASRCLSSVFGHVGLVAVPNSRSSHATPTPVGVGVVVPVAVAMVVVVEGRLTWTVAALLAFAVLGFVDDLLDLPAPARLVAQVAIALVGVVSLGDSPPCTRWSRWPRWSLPPTVSTSWTGSTASPRPWACSWG